VNDKWIELGDQDTNFMGFSIINNTCNSKTFISQIYKTFGYKSHFVAKYLSSYDYSHNETPDFSDLLILYVSFKLIGGSDIINLVVYFSLVLYALS